MQTQEQLAKGEYRRGGPNDLRGPCPFVNSLANHGYIARDGRNIHADELYAGVKSAAGISTGLSSLFAFPIYNEVKETTPERKQSIFGRIFAVLRNPWLLLSKFALRNPGQTDSTGKPCMHLDQLARHNVVEHDVSLTRRDIGQGDNLSPQPDLIQALLDSSSDGKVLTAQDLAGYRIRRIEQQQKDNAKLGYGAAQHQVACGEIALILNVFGDGKKMDCEYARAFFQEERLPLKEGWKKRSWWSLGVLEFVIKTEGIKKLIGWTPPKK